MASDAEVTGTITVRPASRWSEFSNDELRRIEAALLRAHTLEPTGPNMLLWSAVYDELDRRGQAPGVVTDGA